MPARKLAEGADLCVCRTWTLNAGHRPNARAVTVAHTALALAISTDYLMALTEEGAPHPTDDGTLDRWWTVDGVGGCERGSRTLPTRNVRPLAPQRKGRMMSEMHILANAILGVGFGAAALKIHGQWAASNSPLTSP